MSISIGLAFFRRYGASEDEEKKLKVKDARKILSEGRRLQNLLDMDAVTAEAVENAEQGSIVFIDEIDKIADSSEYGRGPEFQRGVCRGIFFRSWRGQRRQYEIRSVKTDHILFIGAGAFHVSETDRSDSRTSGAVSRFGGTGKPLTKDALEQILTVPKNALITQHKLMLETEGIKIDFTDDAVDEYGNRIYDKRTE